MDISSPLALLALLRQGGSKRTTSPTALAFACTAFPKRAREAAGRGRQGRLPHLWAASTKSHTRQWLGTSSGSERDHNKAGRPGGLLPGTGGNRPTGEEDTGRPAKPQVHSWRRLC